MQAQIIHRDASSRPESPSLSATEMPPPAASPRANPSLKRRVKDLGKRGLRRLFEVGQGLGFDVLPRHFYSQVPDIRELRREAGWKEPFSLFGVAGSDTDGQFDFLESCCPTERTEELRTAAVHRRACETNGEPGFGPIDADSLFAFIRAVRPERVVQVGCGVSTAVILDAARGIKGYRPEIVCVEPYPTEFLKRAAAAGDVRLVPEKAQTVPLEVLTDLGPDGFLFIDSTHTVKPGSEVNRVILEVLPRLAPGSWAHFHDIYLPYDYQRGLLEDELFFSAETSLLHAFLVNNPGCSIRLSLSMLHHADPARLMTLMPNYRPAANDRGLRAGEGDFPSSIYLRMS